MLFSEPLDGSNIPRFGSSTGLVSNVKESVWAGGELMQNNQYPRVNNTKGYVSVYGRTTTNNAPIEGKQLMFSVDFIATANGDITFSIMDAESTAITGNPATSGGDPLLASEGTGATWQLVRKKTADGDLDLESYFDFNEDSAKYIPKVNSVVTPLSSLTLSLQYNKDGKRYDVEDESSAEKDGDPSQTRTYYTVDKTNADHTYVIQANPKPLNATDAAVEKWEIAFDDFTGLNPDDKM